MQVVLTRARALLVDQSVGNVQGLALAVGGGRAPKQTEQAEQGFVSFRLDRTLETIVDCLIALFVDCVQSCSLVYGKGVFRKMTKPQWQKCRYV